MKNHFLTEQLMENFQWKITIAYAVIMSFSFEVNFSRNVSAVSEDRMRSSGHADTELINT